MSLRIQRDGTALWRGKPVGTVEKLSHGTRQSDVSWRFTPAKKSALGTNPLRSAQLRELTHYVTKELLAIERDARQ